MDTRYISEYYTDVAEKIINEEPALGHIVESDVQIVYLSSKHNKKAKGKTVYAECEKISDKYKWGIPADFTITVFEPNVTDFTEEQIRILLFHELLHVGIEGDKYSVRPHDLEDFAMIIDRFGTDWDKTTE